MLASSTYLYEKNTKVSSVKVNSVIKKENEFNLSIEANRVKTLARLNQIV